MLIGKPAYCDNRAKLISCPDTPKNLALAGSTG